MNELDRIIKKHNELDINDITEIKSILEKYNGEDKHKLIACREIYLVTVLKNNWDQNYILHEVGFIVEQIESIIREKENLEHKDLSDSYYKKGLIMKWLNKSRESIACFTDALRHIIVDSENKFTFFQIYVSLYDYGIFNRFTQTRA